MPLAVSFTTAVLSGLGVLAMIVLPYWVLYRIFRNDGDDADGED